MEKCKFKEAVPPPRSGGCLHCLEMMAEKIPFFFAVTFAAFTLMGVMDKSIWKNQDFHLPAMKRTNLKEAERIIKILLWNSTRKWWMFPDGPLSLQDNTCPVKNCWTTHDRGLINQSDAVLIFPYYDNISDLGRMGYSQLLVFVEREPPRRSSDYLKRFANVYGVTLTYRNDSDIPVPYGKVETLTSRDIDTSAFSKPDRKDRALWIVSNCNAQSERVKYVNQLSEHFPVDVFGYCGTNQQRVPLNGSFLDFIRSYKFYLAFENNICRDYVTEKVWRSLEIGVVPIVLGGASYSKALPPNSYLDVRNFSSPKLLSRHLRYLSENKKAYEQYFMWKKDHAIFVPNMPCELCKYLNARNFNRQIDLYKWWTQDSCTSPSIYFRGVADMVVDELNNR